MATSDDIKEQELEELVLEHEEEPDVTEKEEKAASFQHRACWIGTLTVLGLVGLFLLIIIIGFIIYEAKGEDCGWFPPPPPPRPPQTFKNGNETFVIGSFSKRSALDQSTTCDLLYLFAHFAYQAMGGLFLLLLGCCILAALASSPFLFCAS